MIKKNEKYSYLENNIYFNNPPDFKELSNLYEDFRKYVFTNKYGGYSIKWSDKDALKELNRTLLKKDFSINYWDIPDGNLIPTITSRLNYICWIKKLLDDFIYLENKKLTKDKNKNFPKNKKKINYQQKFLNNFFGLNFRNNNDDIKFSLETELENLDEKIIISGLDIGVGANCIYPLLGYGMYKWHFKGTDINSESLKTAKLIIRKNNLENYIDVSVQININSIFYSVVKPKEIFYFCMCNPPYFDFTEEKSDNPHTVKIQLIFIYFLLIIRLMNIIVKKFTVKEEKRNLLRI